MTLLLTGGTGSVGIEFLRCALDAGAFDEIAVLVRAQGSADLEARRCALMRALESSATRPDATPIRVLAGDVAHAGLGLQPEDDDWVTRGVTHVVHAAAVTDFNADVAQTRPINLDGTRHVMNMVRRLSRLEAVAHVSTLYVAGRRTGLINDEPLDHDDGFVQAYEQTKYEAEQYLRTSCLDLPLATYRLSLLMGRASDGYVHRTLEAHKMFELFLSGRARRIPGHPSHTLDMLPTDYAAGVLHRLFLDHFTPGSTVQIAAGDAAPTGADLVETCRRQLGHAGWDVEWIDADEWARLRAADGGDELSPAAFWMFDVVADYLFLPKRFVRRHLDERLGAAFAPPRPLDYLPRIVEARVACRWGRG